jgi:hypothetical protein
MSDFLRHLWISFASASLLRISVFFLCPIYLSQTAAQSECVMLTVNSPEFAISQTFSTGHDAILTVDFTGISIIPTAIE